MGIYQFFSVIGSRTYTDRNGYLRYEENDQLVHRKKAIEKIGRRLQAGEVVHQINARRFGSEPSHRGFKKKKGFSSLF